MGKMLPPTTCGRPYDSDGEIMTTHLPTSTIDQDMQNELDLASGDGLLASVNSNRQGSLLDLLPAMLNDGIFGRKTTDEHQSSSCANILQSQRSSVGREKVRRYGAGARSRQGSTVRDSDSSPSCFEAGLASQRSLNRSKTSPDTVLRSTSGIQTSRRALSRPVSIVGLDTIAAVVTEGAAADEAALSGLQLEDTGSDDSATHYRVNFKTCHDALGSLDLDRKAEERTSVCDSPKDKGGRSLKASRSLKEKLMRKLRKTA